MPLQTLGSDCRVTNNVICTITVWIWRVVLPLLTSIGTIGNTINVIILLRENLRSKPCFILVFLAVSDLIVLWSMFVLDGLEFGYGYRLPEGVCLFVHFLKYGFGSMSLWIVAIFTIERFLFIIVPHQSNTHLTKTKIMVILCGILVVDFPLIGYTFFASSPGNIEQNVINGTTTANKSLANILIDQSSTTSTLVSTTSTRHFTAIVGQQFEISTTANEGRPFTSPGQSLSMVNMPKSNDNQTTVPTENWPISTTQNEHISRTVINRLYNTSSNDIDLHKTTTNGISTGTEMDQTHNATSTTDEGNYETNTNDYFSDTDTKNVNEPTSPNAVDHEKTNLSDHFSSSGGNQLYDMTSPTNTARNKTIENGHFSSTEINTIYETTSPNKFEHDKANFNTSFATKTSEVFSTTSANGKTMRTKQEISSATEINQLYDTTSQTFAGYEKNTENEPFSSTMINQLEDTTHPNDADFYKTIPNQVFSSTEMSQVLQRSNKPKRPSLATEDIFSVQRLPETNTNKADGSRKSNIAKRSYYYPKFRCWSLSYEKGSLKYTTQMAAILFCLIAPLTFVILGNVVLVLALFRRRQDNDTTDSQTNLLFIIIGLAIVSVTPQGIKALVLLYKENTTAPLFALLNAFVESFIACNFAINFFCYLWKSTLFKKECNSFLKDLKSKLCQRV